MLLYQSKDSVTAGNLLEGLGWETRDSLNAGLSSRGEAQALCVPGGPRAQPHRFAPPR